MNPIRQKPEIPWPLIGLFIVLSVVVIVMGILFYKNQEQNLLKNNLQELGSISDLKIRQITQWRQERFSNANFLSEDRFLIRKFKEYSDRQDNELIRSELIQNLKSLIINFDYNSIRYIDPEGDVKLSFPIRDTLVEEQIKQLLPGIIHDRKVYFGDLHKESLTGYVHIDLIIPFIENEQRDSSVFGLMILSIDPQKVLYPLIQSWPSPSKTAETLIVRREGDEIVYLNELRHVKNIDLNLRKQISEKNLPAAMAINEMPGTISGIDYRGVPVVAAMHKIPGSPWYMIAKVDKTEILSSLESQMTMVIVIIILLILATGTSLSLLWRNQRINFFRDKYEAEKNRLALVKHFDYILKFANDIILLFDDKLTVVEANDRALESYMYTREEFIGMKLESIKAPEALSQLPFQIKNVNENESFTFETFHKRKDNSVFPIEISSRVVTIEGLKFYQSIGRDITKRKFAEDILRENELRFRKIFEESPFPMVMTSIDFRIVRANISFCNMIGYSEEELKSFTFRNFTHPDHIISDEKSLYRMIKGEILIYKTEKRYIRKDGSTIWGSATINTISNTKDEIQFFLAMVEDITLQKEAKTELEKSLSLLKATLESTADGILVVDASGKIVQLNQRFTEMWRIPPEILTSGEDKDAVKFVAEQLVNPEIFIENIKQLYSEPEITTSDLLEFKDGRFFERYSQPQLINGKSVGRVWSFRDITESKKAEAQIIAAKERAEESDRLKTAFLHNVSHEIRTPMNAIIGFSSLLNDQGLDELERRQYIEFIFQSGNQLLSIINDIVDIANIEAGQTRVNMGMINVNSTLRSLNDQFSIKERSPGVSLNLKITLEDEKSNIITDSTKLIQILSNLLNNAVKFTTAGSIDFGYELKNEFLEFFVSDTGIGIPIEHQVKIFNRFYQVDGTISRQFGGTGLGLSICKAYIGQLGGEIWLVSQPGIGSSFRFTIPYKV